MTGLSGSKAKLPLTAFPDKEPVKDFPAKVGFPCRRSVTLIGMYFSAREGFLYMKRVSLSGKGFAIKGRVPSREMVSLSGLGFPARDGLAC